ncbi:hypothetical protein EVAR_31470_1 [Eumeta japonica]|uniref:Uncharacterized protein n=1 Tax=Eumeta variegata TaxID=151549 RepID=A0A4C1WAM8_EUMVA|nr:hypothetical protein EVAR_31470_1 [Eumeta japonica]
MEMAIATRQMSARHFPSRARARADVSPIKRPAISVIKGAEGTSLCWSLPTTSARVTNALNTNRRDKRLGPEWGRRHGAAAPRVNFKAICIFRVSRPEPGRGIGSGREISCVFIKRPATNNLVCVYFQSETSIDASSEMFALESK